MLTSLDHGPLTNSGFRTFCHLCKHCTSVLSGKHSAEKVEGILSRLGFKARDRESFLLTEVEKRRHKLMQRRNALFLQEHLEVSFEEDATWNISVCTYRIPKLEQKLNRSRNDETQGMTELI